MFGPRDSMIPEMNFSLERSYRNNAHLLDSANNTQLEFFAPWDSATSLIDDIRDALSNASFSRSWNYDTGNYFGTEDLVDVFAEQIEDVTNEITTIVTMLLDEFVLLLSSPTHFDFTNSIRGVPTLLDVLEFNDSSLLLHLNASDDRISWLQSVEHDVAVIEAWEDEAEKLSAIAVAALDDLKVGTLNVKEDGKNHATAVLKTIYEGKMREILTSQENRIRSANNMTVPVKDNDNSILLSDQTWRAGGFEVDEIIQPITALDKIKSIPLKTYKLLNDKQHNLGVDKSEKRTRYHVGVVGKGDNDTSTDSSAIFVYNMGAVSYLATCMEQIASKLTSLKSFSNSQASFGDTLSAMKTQVDLKGKYSFKSLNQLASEVAALETEAAFTRILYHSQSITASIRMNLMRSRFMSHLISHAQKSLSSESAGVVESDSLFEREVYADDTGTHLDRLLIWFEALNKMKTIWTRTGREFAEMHEEAKSASRIAVEEVRAEAAVERDNEDRSLDRIRLLGAARMKEMVHVIEVLFRHLSECLQHIVTPQGREQFMFYVSAIATLVFTVMTVKELIALVCICILRFFTAPRLVREYGNLKITKLYWFAKQDSRKDDLILPANIKERIDTTVNIARIASERHLPLQSILIYGEPGCGKSMTAKTIAQSIPELPFALITGADIYPLGCQGPAELRRLLMWASKKHKGGIIIIDQAEIALGSRAQAGLGKSKNGKTMRSEVGTVNRRYARDCLNVILSMTGTFGNIMLILTTSNPSALDEAVLDRMDEIIYIPLPSAEERSVLLLDKFSRQFKQLDDRGDDNKSLSKYMFNAPISKAHVAHNFDPEKYVFDLAVKTRGFSGRELEKIMYGVVYKTHASESGMLDIDLWVRETEAQVKAVADKHTIKY